jgi:hypothetical protein
LDINVKDIIIKPINSTTANAFVKKHHYSGKVVPNSQLHFGAFYDAVLHGVMSFGPSLDKSKIIGLVKDTKWNDFLELNRMAFDDYLPKNSESRSISVAMKLIKKHYPNIKWIISFADGTQCGDGTIYRASGFVLTQIKENTGQRIDEKTREVFSQVTFSAHRPNEKEYWRSLKKLAGFQLRYIYFLNKEARNRLTVPILPFSAIDKMGAGMYLGKKKTSGGSVTVAQPAIQQERGGSIPTSSQNSGGE